MSTKKQLLFSKNKKKEKTDKSTSMGEVENAKGMLGVPQNNNKQELNSEQKNTNEKSQQTEKENKDNEKKIERTSDTYLKNTTTKDLKKQNDELIKTLESLKKKIEKERKDFIEEINLHDKKYKQKNAEIKKLSNEYNKKIETLKNYEKSLVLKKKVKTKTNIKTEEEIKKEILLIETQIEIYQVRANMSKKDFSDYMERYEFEENKEKILKEKLDELNKEISSLEETVNELKKIALEHDKCQDKNEKMIKKIKMLREDYKIELEISKQFALAKLKEQNEIDDEDYNEKEDEKDNINKAIEEQSNILPKIQNIQFNPDSSSLLEMKIIKKNKIGIKNSNSNAIYLFKNLSKEFNDSKRFQKEANKNIRINQSNINIKTEQNCLFKDYENNMLQKLLPIKLINSYQGKYNDIILQKKDIEKKYLNESNNIKYENLITNYKKDFNDLKLKELNQKQAILNLKYQKLKEKTNIVKKNIKEIEKQIKKEEDKIKLREKDRERIEIYFKGRTDNKNNNNKNNNNK